MTPEEKPGPDTEPVPEPAAFLEIQLDEGPRPPLNAGVVASPKSVSTGSVNGTSDSKVPTPVTTLEKSGNLAIALPDKSPPECSPPSQSSSESVEELVIAADEYETSSTNSITSDKAADQPSLCSVHSDTSSSEKNSSSTESAVQEICSPIPGTSFNAESDHSEPPRPSIICFASNSDSDKKRISPQQANATTTSRTKRDYDGLAKDSVRPKSSGSTGRKVKPSTCWDSKKKTVVRNLFGRSEDSSTRLLLNPPGFIELTSLLPSTSSGVSTNLMHRIQVGQKHTKVTKHTETPPPQTSVTPTQDVSPLPSVNESDYVTVQVYHTDPKVDRLIRCYACQTVLKFIKVSQRGKRNFPKNLNPETFYCNYCLKRKFATREHYEYCN